MIMAAVARMVIMAVIVYSVGNGVDVFMPVAGIV